MRLSPGQVETLKALTTGKKTTSNITMGSVVSGTAATALEKRGLVTRTEKNGTTTVAITAAGRKELKENAERAKVRARRTSAVAKQPRKPAARKPKGKVSASA